MTNASPEALRYYASHPVQFVRSVIGAEPDATQCQIMESVVHNKMTSVRSGHGIGKTATAAWLICWFLLFHPHAKIPCTAPTQNTLRDVLWNELAKWISKSPFLKHHLVWTREKVSLRGHEEDWYAVARTATKPEALQGFHAQYLMYVIDEASGVPDAVFEPVLGSLSTAGSRLVMFANPTQLSGFFFDSHHSARASYNCIRADGRNSSRVSQQYVDQIIAMFGEDSDVFRVRVAGDFPNAADDTFIPLPWVERAASVSMPDAFIPDTIDIACDVARFGSDQTVIGYKLGPYVQFHTKRRGQDTMRTASEIALLGCRLAEKYGFEDDVIPVKIDDSGVGGGVTDRLRQMKREDPERYRWMNVQAVTFGRHLKGHRYYDDSTTHMMANVRDLIRPTGLNGEDLPLQLVLPNDEELISQLSVRKYSLTPVGKIRVESKEKMKERGLHSPDEADCVLMLCLPFNREKAARRRR